MMYYICYRFLESTAHSYNLNHNFGNKYKSVAYAERVAGILNIKLNALSFRIRFLNTTSLKLRTYPARRGAYEHGATFFTGNAI
jgi:hypothetical protein